MIFLLWKVSDPEIAAHDMQLDPDRVRMATELLMTTGRIQKEALRKEVKELTTELKASKAEDAPKYVEALEFIEQLIKGVQIEKE